VRYAMVAVALSRETVGSAQQYFETVMDLTAEAANRRWHPSQSVTVSKGMRYSGVPLLVVLSGVDGDELIRVFEVRARR